MTRTPARWIRIVAPLILVVIWLGVSSLGGPTFGKLSTVVNNDQASYLPASAESTQVQSDLKKFFPADTVPAIVVYARSTGLTSDDTRAVADRVTAFGALDGVGTVVDSGLARRPRYDRAAGLTRLVTERASQASVTQRAGRAGRQGPGFVYRLWEEAANAALPRFDPPEIMEADLSALVLDCAIWGHVSDGNVHPNVIPKSYDDVLAGREAILEFGREAARLAGCPLAEHGVGRSSLKQALLRQFYGEGAIEEMRAIKYALDPDGKLAPGVIFTSAS